MEEFDFIVIGAGSGLEVSSVAAALNKKVAIVEEGPMGGTCLNRGCIPSKMLIHSADVIATIKRAPIFGIYPKGYTIDFKKMVNRVTKTIDEDARSIEHAIRSDKYSALFKTRGKFIGERTLQVGNKKIRGEKIIIAAGTRPSTPPIEGLKETPFITSDQALRLTKQPKTLTIVGGGYIAAELAHFFGELGTKITIVQRDPMLIPNEDEEIAKAFTKTFSKKYKVFLEHSGLSAKYNNNKFTTTIAPKNGKGQAKKLISEQLLIAVGRTPNTDLLEVEKSGVKTNKFGYVITNNYLETTAKNVWALGDIAGKFLFKHSANLEAEYVVQNAIYNKRLAVDYTAMPHAIFSSPQIAGVGERQQDLDARKADYAIGKYNYINTGMGAALDDKEGFVKVYADKKTKKILGCHIIGTDASSIIHEVIVAMKAHGTVSSVLDTVHVHPALPEVVQRAFGNIEW